MQCMYVIYCLRLDQSVNILSAYGAADRTAYVVYVCDSLQNGAISWRRRDELLNIFDVFVFFVHKVLS